MADVTQIKSYFAEWGCVGGKPTRSVKSMLSHIRKSYLAGGRARDLFDNRQTRHCRASLRLRPY